MSYKAVGTNISSINLQSSSKVNLNTANVNTDIYEYEEIDYSQDVDIETEAEEAILSAGDLYSEYGEVYLSYMEDGLIKVVQIKNSTYYLTCSETNYNYYINSNIKTKTTEEIIEETAKYDALYTYITNNKINLDDATMERLRKLSSVYKTAVRKKQNLKPTKLSYKDEVTALLNIFNQELEKINNDIKPLQDEYNNANLILRNPVMFNPNNINGNALKTCERIRPELDALKEQKAMLEAYIYQMNQELALAPYKDIADTSDYQNFIKTYNNNYQNIDYDELLNCGYDPYLYIANKARGKSRSELDAMLARGENQLDRLAIVEHLIEMAPKDKDIDFLTTFYLHFTDDFINYQFMTQEQRDMYHYLFAKKGEDEANKYLEVISDSINQARGAKEAADFIATLNLNDKGKLEKSLANFMGVSKKGLSDGIDTFFSGIENVFVNNTKLTASEYEKMIVLQYLKENSNYYDEIYTFNSALGNMVPSIATSAVVTALATPAAGSIVGSSLMGFSAGGNAKHNALVQGNSLLSSWIYGIFVGGSEATLGYFLGKIPGISQTSGFTLSNLLSEGAEEFLQEWIDAGLQAVILGADVKWEEIPKQSVDSFIMGVLMAGFLNGGQAIINISVNGIVHEINVQKVIKALENNPDMSPQQALEQVYPGILSNLLKRNVNSNTGDTSLQLRYLDSAKIEQVVTKYNKRYNSAFAEILYNVGQNGSTYEVRLACRDLITYLNNTGMATNNIVDIISQAATGAIRKRGFETQVIDFNGNKIKVQQQVGMNYSNQAYRPDRVLNDIARLPVEFQQLVKEINFYDTFNPDDFYWEQRYKIDDFYSAATGGRGQINFYATKYYNLSTIVHEIAHTYDTAYASAWGVRGRISESSYWLDAMRADQSINNLTGVSEYARESSSPVEDFADSVALFYSDPHALDSFPNRKALLTQMLPQNQTVSSAYTLVMDALTAKYGKEAALKQMENYLRSGDLSYITRDADARNIISKFTLDEMRIYHESMTTISVTVDLEAANAFDLAVGAMIRKYGKDIAIQQLQAYLQNGNLQLITSSEGARQALSNVTLENVRTYVKSINNNSLNVANLFG